MSEATHSDDGSIYLIDRNDLITFSSLRHANQKMSVGLAQLEKRFDAATEQILILQRTNEQLVKDNEDLIELARQLTIAVREIREMKIGGSDKDSEQPKT